MFLCLIINIINDEKPIGSHCGSVEECKKINVKQEDLGFAPHPKLKNVNKPMAGSLNKRLMLSSSFRCDQIYMYEIYNFGHTLLCYLSPT
jgi:hypothetical protein